MKKLMVVVLLIVLGVSAHAFAAEESPSSWAVSSINEMRALNQFREDAFSGFQNDITRGQFIYLSVRLYEVLTAGEITVDHAITFTDTDDIYALKGATVGITSGIGNGEFGFSDPLTREQLAALMIRVIELLEIDMNPSSSDRFADDSEISTWAKEAIYKARNNNIISGVGENKVNPQGRASVEVALVITHRIMQEKNGETAVRLDGTEVRIDITKGQLSESQSSEITENKDSISEENLESLKTCIDHQVLTYVGNDERGGVVKLELPSEYMEMIDQMTLSAIITADYENPLSGKPKDYLKGQSFAALDEELVTVSLLEDLNGMYMFEVVDCYYDDRSTIYIHMYLNDEPLTIKAAIVDREIPFLHPFFDQRDIAYAYDLHNTGDDSKYLNDLWFSSSSRIGDEDLFSIDEDKWDTLLEDVIIRMPCSLQPIAGYSTSLVFRHPFTGYHISMKAVYIPRDSVLIDAGLEHTLKYWSYFGSQENPKWIDLDQYDVVQYDPEGILLRFVNNQYSLPYVRVLMQDLYPMPPYWDGSLDDDEMTPDSYSTIDSYEKNAVITISPYIEISPETIQVQIDRFLLNDWITPLE